MEVDMYAAKIARNNESLDYREYIMGNVCKKKS